MKLTNMNFLEKSWTYFMWIVYIEGIMKDLIILKKNPQFIDELNQKIVSHELTLEREKYAAIAFNKNIVDEFCELYKLDKSLNKIFHIVRISRNIYWHSRISINEERLWHRPDSQKRLDELKEFFWIEWIWNNITIDDSNFHFEEKIMMIESLDKEFFPSLAKSIWLDYERIR